MSRSRLPRLDRLNLRRPRRGFTLVEILIVLMLLGILAAIVLPRYANASDESRRAALADQLRIYREQVQIYRAQHRETFPGVTAAEPAGDAALFVAHLSGVTDVTGDTAPARDAAHKFGPYLLVMPMNPISGSSTVKFDASADAVPAADGTTGWIFQPRTGRVSINLTGTDDHGKPYVAY